MVSVDYVADLFPPQAGKDQNGQLDASMLFVMQSPDIAQRPIRNPANKLERWEIALIKRMIASTNLNQRRWSKHISQASEVDDVIDEGRGLF